MRVVQDLRPGPHLAGREINVQLGDSEGQVYPPASQESTGQKLTTVW